MQPVELSVGVPEEEKRDNRHSNHTAKARNPDSCLCARGGSKISPYADIGTVSWVGVAEVAAGTLLKSVAPIEF